MGGGGRWWRVELLWARRQLVGGGREGERQTALGGGGWEAGGLGESVRGSFRCICCFSFGLKQRQVGQGVSHPFGRWDPALRGDAGLGLEWELELLVTPGQPRWLIRDPPSWKDSHR